MNTGTPASTPGIRRYFQRPGPRAPRGRGYAKLIATGVLAAVMLAVIAGAFLYATPSAEAQTNNMATGAPGIVDQANPNDTLTTVRPDMTLAVDTSNIMDDDGLTIPAYTYQWAHWDGTDTTDIPGATGSTYLVTESDIGKAFEVSVNFDDDLSNPEGPLTSVPTQFVGPINLIVWNTQSDPAFRATTPLTATTPKLAQAFVSSSSLSTKSFSPNPPKEWELKVC